MSMNATLATLLAAVASAAVTVAAEAAPQPSPSAQGSAIVVQDQASLRAAPRDGAQQQASLWQGEVLEVRGERLDYLQVWDHKRERGGFIRASDVRRVALTEAEGPALLAVMRFVQDTPGAEALGIGLTAAYLQASPAKALAGVEGAQAFDALGTFADRLARRASMAVPGKASGATLSAHLDVANGYGVRFATYEVEGRMQVCYEGEAFRRLLAMPVADAEQRARAALALTRPECTNPDLPAHERAKVTTWQADVLERVDVAHLPGYLRNRMQMRRASVWGAAAFQLARKSAADPAVAAAAARALTELSGVSKAELPDEDQAAYNDAAMRVSAVRWALVPAAANLRAAGGRTAQRQSPATAPLHLRRGMGRIGQHQPRRHGRGPGGATHGRLARAVGAAQNRRRLAGRRAAPRCHHARDRRGRMGGLGTRRPANAGGPRSPGPGPLPQEL